MRESELLSDPNTGKSEDKEPWSEDEVNDKHNPLQTIPLFSLKHLFPGAMAHVRVCGRQPLLQGSPHQEGGDRGEQ